VGDVEVVLLLSGDVADEEKVGSEDVKEAKVARKVELESRMA
jgi:hypothetical protein